MQIIWNLQKNVRYVSEKQDLILKFVPNRLIASLTQRDWIEITDHRVEKHLLANKDKVPNAVSKEGHADSLLVYKRTYEYGFPWKRCNCKQCFLLAIPTVKFTLLYQIFFQ